MRRLPFIAAWAKRDEELSQQKGLAIPAGVIQPQVAAVQDIFPTVLKVVGAKEPKGHVIDGKALQILLTGQKDEGREEQFLMHYPHGPHRSNYFTTWRDGDWKVIYHALPETKSTGNRLQFGGGNYQLFNLANDPFEQRNMAVVKSDLLKKMMTDMIGELEKHGALYPVDESGNELKPKVP